MPPNIQPIADPADPRLAPYRNLRDADIARAHNLFLVEGRFAVQTLLERSLYCPHSLLLHDAAHDAIRPALDTHAPANLPIYLLPREAMQQLVGFDMHRGCIAAAHRPGPHETNADNLLQTLRAAPVHQPIAILEDLANHDNVGGIFRSAAAFDAAAILCSPRTCDPLYRKAVRVSMAAVLRLPFAIIDDWPAALTQLAHRERLALFALSTADDAATIDDLPAHAARAIAAGRRPALLIGAEGPGLSPSALAAAHHCIRIPMTNAVDSLNATVAASIALQRLAGPLP